MAHLIRKNNKFILLATYDGAIMFQEILKKLEGNSNTLTFDKQELKPKKITITEIKRPTEIKISYGKGDRARQRSSFKNIKK